MHRKESGATWLSDQAARLTCGTGIGTLRQPVFMGSLSYLNTVYAIPSQRADEKRLVKELNALFNTKFKKVTNESMLKAREPRKLEYFHNATFTKAEALYLELTPNEDAAGQLESPENPECAWILYVRALPTYATANGVNVDLIAQRAAEKVARLSFGPKLIGNVA